MRQPAKERGRHLQDALARYLQRWWPNAESTGAGRPGRDVTGTPGVWWECKTGATFSPTGFVRQARAGAHPSGDVPVVVYFPRGTGEANTANTLAILPLHVLMRVLTEAQYAPLPAKEVPADG